MQVPVTVLNATTKREQGRKAQVGNIAAAKVRSVPRTLSFSSIQREVFIHYVGMVQAVSDIIRTTLGPRSMLKMLLDPNGGETLLYDAAHGPLHVFVPSMILRTAE